MSKTKRVMARDELVAFLENILTQIREEKLMIQETIISLPAEAVVELEVEEKKGKAKVELEVEWHLPAGSEGAQTATGTGETEQMPATEGGDQGEKIGSPDTGY
ncbi:MAG: amphi-Trp domain-containing protein [Bacillota bacterium]